LSSLFPPLRQVVPPAQKFVDERPLLVLRTGLPGGRFVGHFCRLWPNGKAAGPMEKSHSAIAKSG
jgi:hypothetical protein